VDGVFDVTCEAASLVGAVAQADQQAADYFGVSKAVIGTLIAREVIRPRAAGAEPGGPGLPWRIDVHYVDLRKPDDRRAPGRPPRGHDGDDGNGDGA
jgi:hypothetical protein